LVSGRNHDECSQTSRSGKLIGESLLQDTGDLVDIILSEEFEGDTQELGHRNNAVLLNLLIDVLLLELFVYPLEQKFGCAFKLRT